MKLAGEDIKIDTSVYNEVVEKGEAAGHEDATIARKFLEKFQVPIIPIDISSKILSFRDPGETSCYILTKSADICISSDKRAISKLKTHGTNTIRLDEFFLSQAITKNLSKENFIKYIEKLEKVYATVPERKIQLVKELENHE